MASDRKENILQVQERSPSVGSGVLGLQANRPVIGWLVDARLLLIALKKEVKMIEHKNESGIVQNVRESVAI